MRRSDHGARRGGARRGAGASRGTAAMRHIAAVAAAGLVLAACAGCTFRLDEEKFQVANATDQTLVLWSEPIAPGQVRTVETEGCVTELHFMTEDGTRIAIIDRMCDTDRVEVVEDDLQPLSQATVVNDSRVPVLITFDAYYPLEREVVAPGAELTLTILGRCVADIRTAGLDSTLYANALLDERQPEVTVVHTGPLCDGARWVIDAEALSAGDATFTVRNASSLELGVSLPGAEPEDVEWLDVGDAITFPLGVPVDECVDMKLVVRGAPLGDDEEVRGSIVGPLCDGEITVTDATLARMAGGEQTLAESPAAVRVVNRTGGELVVELGGPEPYTVSVGADSATTVLLGVPTTECLDASLRVSSVPGSPGATGTAELPGPLCTGDWVVTPDVLAAGG